MLSSFPPTLVSKILSRCGALRCTNVILGKRVTAAWICPHNRTMVSHWEERNGRETLIAAAFHGPLNPTDQAREICMNTFNNGQPSFMLKTEGIEIPRTIRKDPTPRLHDSSSDLLLAGWRHKRKENSLVSVKFIHVNYSLVMTQFDGQFL